MYLTLHDYLLAPECVDERLARLAKNASAQGQAHTSRPLCNVEAEFLEATQRRPIVSRPQPESDTVQHSNGQDVPSSLIRSMTVYRSSNLPLDVFLEIASLVSPLDLIHLARTSKPLRCLLMSKKHRAIWREVLGNVPELPPCPGDVDEPLYAALVFSQYCFECGASDAFWVDYALRLRMCEQCYKANIVEGTEVLKSLPQDWRDKVCDVVLMLVPSANTFDFSYPGPSFDRVNPLSHLRQDFYFKPELEAMLGFFWPLPSPEDIAALRPFVRARVNYIITRQTHAVVLHGWDNHWDLLANTQDDFDHAFSYILETFDGPTFTRLRGPNWDDTPLCEDPALTDYLHRGTSQINCVAARTHHDPLKPHHQLSQEHLSLSQRTHDGREARVRSRFAEVAEWHQAILALPELAGADRDELPNSHAESQLWEELVLEDDARGPLDRECFMASECVVQRIVRALVEYPGKVKRALAEMVECPEPATRVEDAESEPEEEEEEEEEEKTAEDGSDGESEEEIVDEGDSDDEREIFVPVDLATGMTYAQSESLKRLTQHAEEVLLRPTALFVCTECNGGPHPYPEINMHWQREHWDESVWIDLSGLTDMYGAVVWKQGVDVVERILAVLVEKGLPEDERDLRRLDELVGEGRVFCACGDPNMDTPEEDLSWAELVGHVFIHLDDNSLRTKTSVTSATSKAPVEDAPVWLNDHDLTSCIRYLPEGADTSEASNRVTADESTRKRIEALLGQCPEKSLPVCRLCDVLTPDDKKDDTLFLTENVDGIFYHMQAKHGKQVEDQDTVFWEESIFDEPLEPTDL